MDLCVGSKQWYLMLLTPMAAGSQWCPNMAEYVLVFWVMMHSIFGSVHMRKYMHISVMSLEN